jgi:DNA recombination protein RmuC
VQIKDDSLERVEFAIKLPGHENEVLLSVDAKFPQDDYERLIAASEAADIEAMAEASKALEMRIKSFAKLIREKYINPPRTTAFAILFLPTESLYAEILRRPGVFEGLPREHHVTLTGPATFAALLNALQMGFERGLEDLGAVRDEFGKYNEVVDGLARQLSRAAKSVEKLGARTRVMDQKLRNVEKVSDTAAQMLLSAGCEQVQESEEGEEAANGSYVLALSVSQA